MHKDNTTLPFNKMHVVIRQHLCQLKEKLGDRMGRGVHLKNERVSLGDLFGCFVVDVNVGRGSLVSVDIIIFVLLFLFLCRSAIPTVGRGA